MRKTTHAEPLEDRFAKTHPSFQDRIHHIAQAAQMEPIAVYALWREYSTNCDSGDQSPVLGEFIEWYADKMNGNKARLHDASRL